MLRAIQPRPSETLWLYERDGEVFGPTDLSGLQVMADSLHLRPECEVWQQGQQERMRAIKMPGVLFPPVGPPPLPTDGRYMRFYRSADDRVFLGVCGGLAHRWGLPSTAVRAAMLLLLFAMVGWAYVFGALLPALPTKTLPRPAR